MPLFQSYTFSTVETLISDLATFAVSNGWAIVSQTATILSISKSGNVFRIEKTGTASAELNVTPSGGIINTESVSLSYLVVGQPYMFVSTGRGLLIGRSHTSYFWRWGGLVFIEPKIGVTGGVGVLNVAASNALADNTLAGCTYYINGAWTSSSAVAGSVVGSVENDIELVEKQPNTYNGAVMPVPITMFVMHTTTTLWRPIGFLENVFRFRAGDVFVHGDTLTIGADTYLAVAQCVSACSYTTASRDMLIKLGA